MSFFEKNFPWLYEEVIDTSGTSVAVWQERLSKATPEEKVGLATDKKTPTKALSVLARDPDQNIRTILTERLAKILPNLSATDQVELYDLTIEAIKSLAEDQVTSVRVALASALKDVVKTPHEIARHLADDAERAVAEPILRFSLSLSDQDLLELIARHPHDWHPVIIAQRYHLSEQIGHAIAITENVDAGRALLKNDSAKIGSDTQKLFGRNKSFEKEIKARDGFMRKLKREWMGVTDQVLYKFLRENVALNQVLTTDVMNKVHQHMTSQENIKVKAAHELTEEEITDALKFGENSLVIEALAHRSKIPVQKVRRMLEADNARAVIALCVKAKMPMSFAAQAQAKLARLAPAKILYPKNGDQCPLSDEDLKWQWDFFGVN